MGAELEIDERVMAELREFFDARGRVMTENNIKQAYLPKGCIPLYNRTGTAPGFVLTRDGKTAICFPGPPHEMKWLFENGARQYLESLSSKSMYYKVVRTIGIGESDLETALLPLIDEQTDPTIATYAKEGECTLRVASQRDTPEEAKEAVEEMLSKIDEIVGRYIYSYDDEELNEVKSLPEPVNEKPIETIGGGYVRAYLRPYIRNGHEKDKLITAFINSANAPHGKRESFIERLELVHALAKSGNAPFSAEEFDCFIAEYRKHWTEKGIPAVHHSERYRNVYYPAYRVLSASEAAAAGILY